jgi:hypothetical protein
MPPMAHLHAVGEIFVAPGWEIFQGMFIARLNRRLRKKVLKANHR